MKTKTSRVLNPNEAIEILKAFYHEVKKEIKKSDETRIRLNEDDPTASLEFICDGFDLSFTVKKGARQ